MIRRSIVAVAAVIAFSAVAASTQAFADVDREGVVADSSLTQAVVASAASLLR